MPQQIIDVGLAPNDGLGDSIRTSFIKSNDNFTELYSQTLNPVANTYFVQVTGSDSRPGTTIGAAFRTIEKALQVATDRKAADPAAITLIEVGAGRYMTQGHMDMPDDCIMRCTHRTVVIFPEPGYEERNQLRLGSGCFVEGFLFEGWRVDSLDDPSEGFAISFRPGAVIRRVPYAHKCAIRTIPTWTTVPPPTNPFLANPLFPRGAGVALADGLVCSPYSLFPNIMTWGATPVSPNGIGYCAKNGGLINAINAVSLWAHKHYLALSGGQIILSSCSTQFGDYTLVANGSRQVVFPTGVTGVTLIIDLVAVSIINFNKQAIVDTMWTDLVEAGYTAGWTTQDEIYTRYDAATYIQCISWVLESADELPMENFAKGLFDTMGNSIIDPDKLDAFLFAFENIRDQIIALPGIDSTADGIITALVTALETTILFPVKRTQPSLITSVGHQWSSVLAGVALTRIPPAINRATIQASILEQNDGLVTASGQDDQGNAIFVGGMKITADTGELSGPPFDSAVGRIATKSAIAFSSF